MLANAARGRAGHGRFPGRATGFGGFHLKLSTRSVRLRTVRRAALIRGIARFKGRGVGLWCAELGAGEVGKYDAKAASYEALVARAWSKSLARPALR